MCEQKRGKRPYESKGREPSQLDSRQELPVPSCVVTEGDTVRVVYIYTCLHSTRLYQIYTSHKTPSDPLSTYFARFTAPNSEQRKLDKNFFRAAC